MGRRPLAFFSPPSENGTIILPMANGRKLELERGAVWPLVFKLTFPAVVAQLISFLYNTVDRIFVSNIPGESMEALAALGIVLPIAIVIQAFANLIGLGGAPRASMKLGEGKGKEANVIFNNAFVLLLIIGIVLSFVCYFAAKPLIVAFGCPEASIELAVSYLKAYSFGVVFVLLGSGLNAFITAQGRSFLAMMSTLLGAIINIGLDPLFIFAFNMGVSGAAYATVISQLISSVWVLATFFGKKSVFRFCFKDMVPNPKAIWAIVSLGLSPFVMTATECLIQIVFNVNLNWASGGDKNYTAALTIMLSALQLISLPLNGMGYGMQPFISYNYGRGDSKRLKEGIKDVALLAFGYALVTWSISLIFPEVYSYLFSASEEVGSLVKTYTPFFLMGTIMFFVQMTLQNVNVALGQAKSALVLAILRKIVILIPSCFLLTHFLGCYGVYLSEGIADCVAGGVTAMSFIFLFPRVMKKREREIEEAKEELSATKK